MRIEAKEIKLVALDKIKLNPNNRNKHPQEQIEALTKILKRQGFRRPVTISNRTKLLVCGEGRYLAAKELGIKKIPVMYQDYESEEQEYADAIADNAIDKWSQLDMLAIQDDIAALKEFDHDLLGLKALVEILDEAPGLPPNEKLADKFLEAPFSVLSARSGPWQERKRAWISLGIKSELGRGGGAR